MRADDAFWAARIVSTIQRRRYPRHRREGSVLGSARDRLHRATLIERRNRVLKTWLTAVNPLVDFALSADGVLTFNNAAVDAGVATPANELSRALGPIRQRDGRDRGSGS